MKTLYLHAKNLGYYVIHPDGNIERTDQFMAPSGKWKFLGLTLTARRKGKEPKFFPADAIDPDWLAIHDISRYTVRDLDYGTVREWGNTEILDLWFFDRPEDTNYYKYTRDRMRAERYLPPLRSP